MIKVDNDYPTYDVISEEDKKHFLLQKGYPFFAIALIILILSIYNLIVGRMFLFYFFLVIALGGCIAGITPLYFWSEDKKRDYITSKLYRMSLEYQKKMGISYSAEELDRMRFKNDPLFRQNVETKVRREADNKYKKSVDGAKNNLIRLQKQYERRRREISDARWEKLNGEIMSNPTEGKLIINGAECFFSDIKGAVVVNQTGTRTESQAYTHTEEHTEEKRSVSVGGAIVGGLVAGPIGAVAGGIAFGKNKSETVQERKTDVRNRNIPVCNHLGVQVDLNGFETEIVLISSQVDQSSYEYKNKLKKANDIVSTLRVLASSPMPTNVLAVDQEPELLLLYEDISDAKKDYEKAKAARPVYQIPERYLDAADNNEFENVNEEEDDEIIDLTSDDSTLNLPGSR